MPASAAVALRPYNEAPRAVLADRRGTTIFVNNSADDHNHQALDLQPGRIIATHWLRDAAGQAS